MMKIVYFKDIRQGIKTKSSLLRRCYSNNKKETYNSLCNKLSILGGGQMAEAILNALNTKKVQEMKNIHLFDINEDRLDYLKDKYQGINVYSNAQDCIDKSDITIIAVKPQNVTTLASSLTKPPTGLLLSIVAGLTISDIQKKFSTPYIIRSMPNTPAMVLEGMTVWTSTDESPPELIEIARKLLNSFGEHIEVADESYLDMATAISGSGPAYIFLTMEAMVDAAVHLGFPRDIAKKLVVSTMRGNNNNNNNLLLLLL